MRLRGFLPECVGPRAEPPGDPVGVDHAEQAFVGLTDGEARLRQHAIGPRISAGDRDCTPLSVIKGESGQIASQERV